MNSLLHQAILIPPSTLTLHQKSNILSASQLGHKTLPSCFSFLKPQFNTRKTKFSLGKRCRNNSKMEYFIKMKFHNSHILQLQPTKFYIKWEIGWERREIHIKGNTYWNNLSNSFLKKSVNQLPRHPKTQKKEQHRADSWFPWKNFGWSTQNFI